MAPNDRRGVVLVVVTVVIILVSLAAYGFVALMQAENKAAHVRGDQLQAESVAASALELIETLLELPRQQRAAAGGLNDNPGLFQGRLVDGLATDARQGRFSVLSPGDDPMASGTYRFGLENESAKLPLARLLEWDQAAPGSARAALMNLPGMTETTADCLLDWIDQDSTPRQLGAESDYYRALDPPYPAANAMPQALEELLLVKGVTRELLLGLDLNVNYRVDPFEQALTESQMADRPMGPAEQIGPSAPWVRMLTLYSAERNESYEGRPRIFLNQSDLPALHQQLLQTFDAAWANFIVAYRQYGPADVTDSGAEDASSFTVDLSRPAKFPIQSPLDLVGVTVKIEDSSSTSSSEGSSSASSESGSGKSRRSPKMLASPFREGASASPENLPRLCDETTVCGQPVIRGRVNINAAPRAVLAGLPGMDAALVERIVAARAASGAANDGHSRHAIWLLAEGLVDRPTMRRLLPLVTTGGDVARAQVVGFYDGKSPWMRLQAVVDGTHVPARRVYYKNLRNLGRGFASVQLATATSGQGPGLPTSITPNTPPSANH